ncbi:MAG: class I SAM-dependent RNA methyltransferase [Christensenellaceae bacterium]|nr:class I SAM-dependent RNA methyltransferase [Christensenellaceae bacterium]
MKILCFASCSFGLEAVVANELIAMGAEPSARDARVYFEADEALLARANIRLSAADRVYIVLDEFTATTFEELFEGVRAIDWSEWLDRHSVFPVLGDSVRSVLKSVPDIQSISKKAIVESLKASYNLNFFKEDGIKKSIYVSILADRVTVAINASGIGLNRRGYRLRNVPAPLRENLAAGLIKLTRWYDRPFYDIMCGGGTIAIEAALQAKHEAPGLKREFDFTEWNDAFKAAYRAEREQALSEIIAKPDVLIFASDIDEKTLNVAKFHARRAGVLDMIRFSVADARNFSPETDCGTIITNPPYAVRLNTKDDAHALYAELGARLERLKNFKFYIICADDKFENHFGIKADKKRKLYNGNIKCCYYQYFRR